MKDRIKAIRKENNLTQSEFGERIGVKGNTITNYENDMRNPSDAIIFSICREFNVNENWLRYGKGPKYKENDAFILYYNIEEPTDWRMNITHASNKTIYIINSITR